MADDPFGFDISVSSDKKKRARTRRGMSGAFETSTRGCDHPGCQEVGQYRAPKSPDDLDEFLWFCKDHVREYNRDSFLHVLHRQFRDVELFNQNSGSDFR